MMHKPLEAQLGIELEKNNTFLVSEGDQVHLFDSRNFMPISKLPLSLMKAEGREPNQVIAMQAS